MAIESMPDSGVEIIKEVTAPLLAPCFCSVTAAGSTPHDQSRDGDPQQGGLKNRFKAPFPKVSDDRVRIEKNPQQSADQQAEKNVKARFLKQEPGFGNDIDAKIHLNNTP